MYRIINIIEFIFKLFFCCTIIFISIFNIGAAITMGFVVWGMWEIILKSSLQKIAENPKDAARIAELEKEIQALKEQLKNKENE